MDPRAIYHEDCRLGGLPPGILEQCQRRTASAWAAASVRALLQAAISCRETTAMVLSMSSHLKIIRSTRSPPSFSTQASLNSRRASPATANSAGCGN